MGIVVKPYTFSSGAVIVAAEHNSNFDTLFNVVNGNLNSANLSPTAGIALSQISFDTALVMSGAITNWAKGADVASTAGTITLGNDGNSFDITGTAAITSITAKAAGTVVMLQFDSTASLVDGSNLKLAGTFQGAAESTITLLSDGTNWFEISRSPAFTNTTTNALSGSIIQTIYTESATAVAVSAAFVNDDTPPLYNEGNAIISNSITPTNASNKIRVRFSGWGSAGGSLNSVVYLTTGTGTSASIQTLKFTPGSNASAVTLEKTITAGGTSAITFYVVGGVDTSTFTYSPSALFGDTSFITLTLEEIKA